MGECAGRLVLSDLILFSLSPLLSDIMVNNPSPVSTMLLEVQVVSIRAMWKLWSHLLLSPYLILLSPSPSEQQLAGDEHSSCIRWNWKATSGLAQKSVSISTLIFATPSLQDWSCDPLCNGCPAPPPNNCWCQHHCSSNAIGAKQSGQLGHYVCAISHLMYESGCNKCVFSNSGSPMGDLW